MILAIKFLTGRISTFGSSRPQSFLARPDGQWIGPLPGSATEECPAPTIGDGVWHLTYAIRTCFVSAAVTFYGTPLAGMTAGEAGMVLTGLWQPPTFENTAWVGPSG